MLRLLIADDEYTIRHGLEQLIDSYKLDLKIVATAEDGIEALELFHQYHPEIVIMDLNMPHLNGLDAIQEIKTIHPATVIIIISGYDDFSYAQRALELGVFRYLLKPVDFRSFRDILVQAIDAHLDQVYSFAQKANPAEVCGETSQQIVLSAVDYIQEHYADNQLTLSAVAQQYHISPSYLARMVKETTGYNFSEYLSNLRLSIAKKLLREVPSLSVNEIAQQTGFSSQHYFSRAFKNHTGYTPLQYRKQSDQ